jgi:hypothetical protein
MENYLLTDLPAALLGAGFDAPNYRACYEAARSALIPVTRNSSGRWSFRADDLPAIAKSLNLPAMARR